MLLDYTPEGSCIGRSNGFSFKNNSGVSVNQWGINRETVTNRPTDVGSCPKSFAFVGAVNIFNRKFHCYGVSAVVANHTFGFSGSSGGIKDIKWMRGLHGNTVNRLGRGDKFFEIY